MNAGQGPIVSILYGPHSEPMPTKDSSFPASATSDVPRSYRTIASVRSQVGGDSKRTAVLHQEAEEQKKVTLYGHYR